jgi:hypothetical protein
VKNLADRPFALIGVNVGGLSVKELGEVMAREKLTWRSFADPGQAGHGSIAKQWNLSNTPTFYLLDHRGVIRHKWTAPPGAKALDAAMEKLLREAEGK